PPPAVPHSPWLRPHGGSGSRRARGAVDLRLPGDAHAAVHLEAVPRGAHGGPVGEQPGGDVHRVGGDGGRADRGAGRPGAHQHARAQVGDRLESSDGPPELFAGPGVLRRRLAHQGRGAQLLGGGEHHRHGTGGGRPPRIRCSGVSGSSERIGSAPAGSPSTTSASARHSTRPPSTAATTVSPVAAPGTVPAARWVAISGPGSSARPASSNAGTASGSPRPTPPSPSGSGSAKNPAPPSARHNGRSSRGGPPAPAAARKRPGAEPALQQPPYAPRRDGAPPGGGAPNGRRSTRGR